MRETAADEAARVADVRSYGEPLAETDDELQDVARLAAHLIGAPIAMVTLVDATQQHTKAAFGIAQWTIKREDSFCARAVGEPGQVMVVPDTLRDARFADLPLVIDAPHVRFYAAAPLVTPAGNAIGTLCVLDEKPRQLTAEQAEILRVLARQVVTHLALRRSIAQLERNLEERRGAEERERRLRHLNSAVVESAGTLVMVLDRAGRVVRFNPACARATGLPATEVLGTEHWGLFEDQGARAEARTRFANPSASHYPRTLRIWWEGPSGRRLVEWSEQALLDEDGLPEYVVGTGTDVTDVHQALEAVRRSEERFRGLVSNISDLITVVDATGVLLYASAAAERLLGTSGDARVGTAVWELIHPDDVAAVREAMRDAIQREGSSQPVEFRVARSEGGWLDVEAIATNSIDDPAIRGVVVTIRDVTERRQSAAVLAAARDEAMEASRLRSEFLAIVSHEIRTPMNAVIGMTGLLLDGKLDDEQRQYADTVRTAGETLLTLINNILDFSKLEARRLELEMIDFDLRELVEDVVELMAEAASAKGLEIMCLVQPDVPIEVRGDPSRLRQVLTNLTNNAVKFTAAGEVIVDVAIVRLLADGRAVIRFEVSDTGIGVPPGREDRLFEPFTQADASTTRRYGGTGLGLAISRQLVEMMGGEIGVDPRPEQGSTFWFTAMLEPRSSSTVIAKDAILSGARVLVVDDNASNRLILVHQLTAMGMVVTAASGGAEAIAILDSARRAGQRIDVALVDVHMPEMDGYAVALAAASAGDGTPAIVLATSSVPPPDGEPALDIAVKLVKPIRMADLRSVMLRSLEGPRPPAVAEPPPAPRWMISPHVLVAEDNAVNQQVVSKVLHKLGYRADLVADGVEALEALSRIDYAAVLMDCQMPRMDGYEASRRIREAEADLRHTPIIAMTAAAMKGDRDRCLAAGMDDYLSKPLRPSEIDAALRRWIKPGPEEAGATTTGQEPLVDLSRLDALDELYEAEGELVALVEEFAADATLRVQEVRSLLGAGDAQGAASACHTLTGSAATIGAARLAACARTMQGQLDEGLPGVAHTGIEALGSELAETLRALRSAASPGRGRRQSR